MNVVPRIYSPTLIIRSDSNGRDLFELLFFNILRRPVSKVSRKIRLAYECFSVYHIFILLGKVIYKRLNINLAE